VAVLLVRFRLVRIDALGGTGRINFLEALTPGVWVVPSNFLGGAGVDCLGVVLTTGLGLVGADSCLGVALVGWLVAALLDVAILASACSTIAVICCCQ
jgi:hypothetical protein